MADGAPTARPLSLEPRARRRRDFLVLAALVVLAYSRTFAAPFVFDDRRVITQNPLVRELGVYLAPWRAEATGANWSQISGLRTRWFAMLTLALDFQVHGLHAAGYHATNLAIHLLAAWLVLDITRRTLRLPRFASSRLAPRAEPVALLVAALFALQPVQTQAVTYIVQRMASLAGALCLLALWAHLRARTAASRRPRVAFSLLAVAAVVLAMLTKQNALTFPLVMLMFDAAFVARSRRELRWLAAPLLAMAIIPLQTLVLGGGLSSGFTKAFVAVSRETTEIERADYLYTQTRVVVTYLRLLLLPVRQNLDYDVRVSTRFTEPAVIAASALLVTLAASGAYLLASRRARDPGWRLVGFGVLWFFVTLIVESGLVPISDLIFEHRLYLPSVGFFLALVAAALLAVPERSARAATVALATLALVFGCATFARNEVWRDELRLWRDTLSKSPNKTRVLNNAGTALKERGRLAESEALFLRTLSRESTNFTALRSLGELARRTGRGELAADYYRRALQVRPHDWIALLNLGDLALERGERAEALRYYGMAAEREPGRRLANARAELARTPAAKPPSVFAGAAD